MQERLSLSRHFFYLGLVLMLGAGVLVATFWPAAGGGTIIGVTVGAVFAVAGRLWHRRVLRSAHLFCLRQIVAKDVLAVDDLLDEVDR